MMDRQRTAILGAVAAVLVLMVLAAGVAIGRASAGGNDGASGDSARDSEGLPHGPTAVENGVPVGFAQSEDGVLGAALAWVPWLFSSPAEEAPEGIDAVLARGVDSPLVDGLSERFQFAPWAGRVSMTSDDEATVTLIGTPLRGNAGDQLDGGIWPLETDFAWDDEAEDWRITAVDTTADFIEVPVQPEDVAGFRVVRPLGGLLGGVVMEEVPGD